MKPTTPFGAALYLYRKKEKRLTQPKLGKKLGVSQAMISDIETGKKDGSSDLRENITKYFGIPYDDFLEAGRRESPQVTPIGGKELSDLIDGKIDDRFNKVYNKPQPTNDLETRILNKHIKVIGSFPEDTQEKACAINSDMVTLAKLDPFALDTIHNTVKFLINERRKTNPAKDNGSKLA